MDRMDTKLDGRADQYWPRVYQGRNRGCSYRQNYGSRNRSYGQDQYQNSYRGRRNYSNRGGNRNYRSNIEIIVGPEIGTATEMIIGITIGQTTEGMIAIKGMVIEAKIMADLGTEIGGIQVAPGKVPNPGVDPKTDMKVEGRVEIIPEIGTGLSLDRDPLLV